MQHTNGQHVCLLIDFENLVYGLAETVGDDRLPEEVNVGVLFALAEEYGSVAVANAYADWRSRNVNQFQVDLYRLGIDLVHVVGKRGKNAVDVRMAVDAVEMLFTFPHIDTFVIVSGDRDFIHVLKALRRRGKKIIGVAPAVATSEDFAALCDRFLRYSALVGSETGTTPRDARTTRQKREDLRSALHRIFAGRREDGLEEGRVKPLLRRELSPTFDESEYGFSSMSQLLRAYPEVVRVETPPGKNDVVCFSARGARRGDGRGGGPRGEAARTLERDELIRDLGLSAYRYEPGAARRRGILTEIHAQMEQRESFSWSEIAEAVLDATREEGLSLKMLAGYHAILRQTKSLDFIPDQDPDLPLKERLIELDPTIADPESLYRRYESGVIHKLVTRLGSRVTVEMASDLLGLRIDEEPERQYVDELLAEINEGLEEVAAS